MNALWTHIVFMKIGWKRVGRNAILSDRKPSIVFGLFNQIYALFAAVDLAKTLGRKHLYVSAFYVNYNHKTAHVPLSKIVDLQSLLIPTSDWTADPISLKYITNNKLSVLQKEHATPNIEVNCCFMMPLPGHSRQEHVRHLRFHPILYQIIHSFLQSHPSFQVVHYRLESDFSSFFYKRFKFDTQIGFRSHLHQQYQHAMTTHLNPNLPTLVVSHYYKDPHQIRDHDLHWDNLIHFHLSPPHRQLLYDHLQLPLSTPIREVEAVIDFMLCTSPNVSAFIGCGGSTFSEAVHFYHDHHVIPSHLLSPHKPI